jgi:superfamily I DNA and/or RNA helicase
MEKCIALYPEAVALLEEQYRMNTRIMGYSSKVFYKDKLKAHSTVADHVLFPADMPLEFVDTAGCGFDEKTDNTSISNPEEAVLLFKHLSQLATEVSVHSTLQNFPSIAIISPYKEQLYVLRDQLSHIAALQPYLHKISVNTIDSFQGQERDIVYISMTRSNSDGVIGFLADTRRMNVAMTRARKKLVIVGDSATLSRHPFYASFIAYAEEHDAYKSAWEYMD